MRLFPEPVGVLTITLEPDTTSISASSCAGYSASPRPSTHAEKASNRLSGSLMAGRSSVRLMAAPMLPAPSATSNVPRLADPEGSLGGVGGVGRCPPLLGVGGVERIVLPVRVDTGGKVGLDVVAEPGLAVGFGFPDLDDAPATRRAGSARVGDEALVGPHERHELADHASVH